MFYVLCYFHSRSKRLSLILLSAVFFQSIINMIICISYATSLGFKKKSYWKWKVIFHLIFEFSLLVTVCGKVK